MSEVTITVAEKRPPGPGRKQWTLFDTAGQRWQVWPDKAQNYTEGSTYKIAFEANNYRGNTLNTISKGELIAKAAEPLLNSPSPRITSGPQPAAMPPTEDARRRDIFVCGAFNNILSNPGVNPLILSYDEMASMVVVLQKVWYNTLGPGRPRQASAVQPKPQPVAQADFDDSIPL